MNINVKISHRTNQIEQQKGWYALSKRALS